MAAFQLLSQARRHCLTKPSSPLIYLLRSNSFSFLNFHRSLCSSNPNDPTGKPEPVPLQPISYPTKPPQNPSPQSGTFPENHRTTTERQITREAPQQQWSREDARYVKDIQAVSPVSYPSRVAPLPEDSVGEENGVANSEVERETRRIEAANKRRSRVAVVEEKLPYPTLIKVEQGKKKDKVVYDLKEAIRLLKANSKRNFDETLEAHVKMTPDLCRTDLKLNGTASLPHGTGKAVRIAVFAEGAAADEARAAGADVVGGEDLIEGIKNGSIKVDFDKCISTPQLMSRVSKEISKILRRSTPNAKDGTVTNDLSRVVREAKKNVNFRKDKSAIVHVGLGKVSFPEDALCENVGAFVHALLLAKPPGLKKSSKYAGYVSTFHLCSTMGPSYPISIQSLSIAADRYNKLQMR